jgi:phosphoglycolate phosphatase
VRRTDSSPRAILLDLDGTLVTSYFRASEAKKEVLNLFQQLVPSNGLRLSDHIRDYFKFVERSVIPDKEKVKRSVSEIIERYELESVERSELKPGAVELLQSFHGNSPVCIVSNSGSRAVNRTLDKFSLHDHLDFVISRDDAPDLKPTGRGIELVLRRFSVRPENAVMIGDTVMDIMAALDAGVTSVALTDGVGRLEELRRVWPDYMMPGLSETRELLSRLWST